VADKVGNVLNTPLNTSVQGAIGFVALEADFPCNKQCEKNCTTVHVLNSNSGWRFKRCLFECAISRFRYKTASVQLVSSCSSLSHLFVGPAGTFKLVAASQLEAVKDTGHGESWETVDVLTLTNQSFFECRAPHNVSSNAQPVNDDCNSTETCSNACAVHLASGDRSAFALCIYECLFKPSPFSNESIPAHCSRMDNISQSNGTEATSAAQPAPQTKLCQALPVAGVWHVESIKFTIFPGLASRVQVIVQPRGIVRECVSSHIWRDSWGNDCDDYLLHPAWCGFERSRQLCCVCGGGSGETAAAQSNIPFATQPLVQVMDACGSPVAFFAGFVTVNATSADNEALTLVGGIRLAPNSGPAMIQFTDLAILEARNAVTLQFSVDFLPQSMSMSESLNVIKGNVANATLVIHVQPSSSQAMSVLPAQPRITTQDAGGNDLEIYHASMLSTLIDANGERKELLGTRVVPVEGGVAMFTDLGVDIAGAYYVLEFCFYDTPVNEIIGHLYLGVLSYYPCVATSTSASFNISVGAACKLNPTLIRDPKSDTLLLKAGEPIENLDLQVQDCGGNLVPDYAENATVELYKREVSVHFFDCFGSGSCSTNMPDISEILPASHSLVKALLDLEVVCTDFDYVTEKIQRISVGSTALRGNIGPWPTCFGRCMQTENLLSQYDVTALVQNGAVPLVVEASKDVDLYPCNGYSLVVRAALTVVAAVPYFPAHILKSTLCSSFV